MDLKCFFERVWDKIENIYYNVKYGIQNLIKWFPIIWSDRNWDHYFIYVIIRHKLHLTEQLIRNYGNHTRHIEDANHIKLCVNLLDRLMKDEYYENAFKNHEEKWGEPDFRWEECDDNSELSELHIDRPNVKSDEDKKQERKEFRRTSKHEVKLRQQDLDMLFNNMRKYIQGWWD